MPISSVLPYSCSAKASSAALCAILLASLALPGSGNAFLGRQQSIPSTLSRESEQALFSELEETLGKAHRRGTERRIGRIEELLAPKHTAMPKNSNGKLGSAAAGYLLHRLFVNRHGWFIKGLEPAGKSVRKWNESSPTVILERHVPQNVVAIFERRVDNGGIGLRELAILAATLEHLVHTEAVGRLNVAYAAEHFTTDDVLGEEEALKVLDTYMSIYVLGFMASDRANISLGEARELRDKVLKVYPTWPDTQEFVREVYTSIAPQRDYMYFNEIEAVIAEVGERYGRWQDTECRQLREQLVAVEDQSPGGGGRVRLADFYGMALNEGKWQFTEKVGYLRELGALDESDPGNIRVIIPNYISGPSNCVASSSYYSVCCMDECESILGQLEAHVKSPEATPSLIGSLVSMVPSATMPANRTLSSWLLKRLDDVAQRHGGLVPFHGRLFLQWLHYAYPRECPFPHLSGTTNPRLMAELEEVTGERHEQVDESVESMRKIMDSSPAPKKKVLGQESTPEEESAMWSFEEELVVWRPPVQAHAWLFGPSEWVASASPLARAAVFVSAIVSIALVLIRAVDPMMGDASLSREKRSSCSLSEKHFV